MKNYSAARYNKHTVGAEGIVATLGTFLAVLAVAVLLVVYPGQDASHVANATGGGPTPTPTWTNCQKQPLCLQICEDAAVTALAGCIVLGLINPWVGVICGITDIAVRSSCRSKCMQVFPC